MLRLVFEMLNYMSLLLEPDVLSFVMIEFIFIGHLFYRFQHLLVLKVQSIKSEIMWAIWAFWATLFLTFNVPT